MNVLRYAKREQKKNLEYVIDDFSPLLPWFWATRLIDDKRSFVSILLQFWDNRVHNGLKYFLLEYYLLRSSQFKKLAIPKFETEQESK